MANVGEAIFSRVHVELVNNNKVQAIYDFAFGVYISQRSFFDEMSRIQNQIITTGTVNLRSGIQADVNEIGGNLAISMEIEALQGAEKALTGLATLGMNVENKIWKQI